MDTNLITILLLLVNLVCIAFIINKLTQSSNTPQSNNFKKDYQKFLKKSYKDNDWLKEKALYHLFSKYSTDKEAFKVITDFHLNQLDQKEMLPHRDFIIDKIYNIIDIHISKAITIDEKELEGIRKRLSKILENDENKIDKYEKSETKKILTKITNLKRHLNRIQDIDSLGEFSGKFLFFRNTVGINNLPFDTQHKIEEHLFEIESKIAQRQQEIMIEQNQQQKGKAFTKLKSLLKKLEAVDKISQIERILSNVGIEEQKLDTSNLENQDLRKYLSIKNNFGEIAKLKTENIQNKYIKEYSNTARKNIKKFHDNYKKSPRKYNKNFGELKKLFVKHKVHKVNNESLDMATNRYYSEVIWDKIFTAANKEVKHELTKWITSIPKEPIVYE